MAGTEDFSWPISTQSVLKKLNDVFQIPPNWQYYGEPQHYYSIAAAENARSETKWIESKDISTLPLFFVKVYKSVVFSSIYYDRKDSTRSKNQDCLNNADKKLNREVNSLWKELLHEASVWEESQRTVAVDSTLRRWIQFFRQRHFEKGSAALSGYIAKLWSLQPQPGKAASTNAGSTYSGAGNQSAEALEPPKALLTTKQDQARVQENTNLRLNLMKNSYVLRWGYSSLLTILTISNQSSQHEGIPLATSPSFVRYHKLPVQASSVCSSRQT